MKEKESRDSDLYNLGKKAIKQLE